MDRNDNAGEPLLKSVRLADGEVSYLEWPGPPGAPVLNFAHANGFNARTYSALLRPLAGRFRILAIDKRGHGFTTLKADPESMNSWAIYRDDIVAFLDALNVKSAVLAGHSMGATASLHAAALRPDLARGLVLCEPVTSPWRWRMAMRIARMLGRVDKVNPLYAMTMRRRATWPDVETMVAAYRGRGAFKTWPEEMLRDYAAGGLVPDGNGAMRLACAPEWEAANYRMGPLPLTPVLKRLRTPLTVLYGTEAGSTVQARAAADIVKIVPTARVLRIEGASHFLPMEHPDLVRREIEAMV